MENLETVEQLMNGLAEFAKTTTRATHSIFFSKERNMWVVNLNNKGVSFKDTSLLGALEAAYVHIKFNRIKTNEKYTL